MEIFLIDMGSEAYWLIKLTDRVWSQSSSHRNQSVFCRGYATYKSPCQLVGLSVRWSVGRSVTLCFFAFLGILRVGKFVFEQALAKSLLPLPKSLLPLPNRPREVPSCLFNKFLSCCSYSFLFFRGGKGRCFTENIPSLREVPKNVRVRKNLRARLRVTAFDSLFPFLRRNCFAILVLFR